MSLRMVSYDNEWNTVPGIMVNVTPMSGVQIHLRCLVMIDNDPDQRSVFQAEFDSTLAMHTLNNFGSRLVETGSVAWLRRAA